MLNRIQEWLADRTRVQYPRLRRIDPVARPTRGTGFALWTKIALALLGLPLFVIGAAGAAFCLYLLWALITSLLGI